MSDEEKGIVNTLAQMEKNLSGQIKGVRNDVKDIKGKIEINQNRLTALETRNDLEDKQDANAAAAGIAPRMIIAEKARQHAPGFMVGGAATTGAGGILFLVWKIIETWSQVQ